MLRLLKKTSFKGAPTPGWQSAVLKRNERSESVTLSIREYQALFEVNLTDYLDTGLFLDHRLVRKELFDKCQGLDVRTCLLNRSASVQAALAVLIDGVGGYVENLSAVG